MNHTLSPNLEYVFWDWHGVLGTKKFWHISSKVDPRIKKFADYAFASNDRIDRWMRNELRLPDLAAASGANISAAQLTAALRTDWANTRDVVNIKLFLSLKQQTPNAQHCIITDNMDIFESYLPSNTFVRENFVRVFNSAGVGRLKKDDPGLFDYVLDNLKLGTFKNTLLIDDSPANCQHFELMGGQTILHAGGNP